MRHLAVAVAVSFIAACSGEAPAPEPKPIVATPLFAESVIPYGDPGDPINAPPGCAGGRSDVITGPLMYPGKPCLLCHKAFTVAGTVYATGHEADYCRGANEPGTKVIATDAVGAVVEMPTNEVGNFYTTVPLVFPLRVRVVDASGAVREMPIPLSEKMRNCNGCHTQWGIGAPRAPGRVTMPFTDE